ncbi:uncharacterized protein K444DRAFT_718305 [Hyaloscypha bicolor E]|uniref:Secreted protein n=1 Tax=Hyaloscypha bicolor E TaxID=1095630 RepID=A0A2J6TJ26_9HELO|nr:uncharacterized protein K444DRAFT_718305 [Hyaloscypha bicolor E]PMD63026.1 hypothetical protein K444DRAFT_718305 [Hyaloscypha bicolor E]
MYFAALVISLRLCSSGSSLSGDPCAVVPGKGIFVHSHLVETLAEENNSTFSGISFNIYQDTRSLLCQIPSAESRKS